MKYPVIFDQSGRQDKYYTITFPNFIGLVEKSDSIDGLNGCLKKAREALMNYLTDYAAQPDIPAPSDINEVIQANPHAIVTEVEIKLPSHLLHN